MANPQPTDAHLRVSHRINEEVMASDFSKRQRKILDLILRLSWGCGKKCAIIPYQRDFAVVGVTENNVRREIEWLINAKVILRDGCEYWFNKDYDQWRVSRALTYDPRKLTELIRLNLSKRDKSFSKQEDDTSQNEKSELLETRSPSATDSATPKERLKKGKEIYNAHFETFWKTYPKKKSKGHAQKAFAKINPDEQLLATMLATIERARNSEEWTKENGKYIPYPAKWLNAEGWEDEATEIMPSMVAREW